MGSPKQLILHDGKPLVTGVAEAALAAGAAPVIVVLGAHAGEVRAALSHLSGVRTVINSGWQGGLASSLAIGLRAAALDASCDGVLVALADQPLVSGDTLGALIAAFRAGARLVASGYDGRPGVPALFGREHLPDLLSLKGDAGASSWLGSRSPEVTIVPLGDAALDVDTPADAAQLARKAGSR